MVPLSKSIEFHFWMQKILIIYPHWVPSNLAGVHRPRLIANYLLDFDWKPILLTVLPEFYEEAHDLDMVRTVSSEIEVHSVKALPVYKPRIVGDIGLRGWFHLRKKALELIEDRKPDFLWIPIPSFYMAILGRVLHDKTGIPYGVDYIDPWVRDIKTRKNWRSQLSLMSAKILEPYAVKKASLISGVNENYYLPVYERNFPKGGPAHIAFPYGFDPNDHTIKLENMEYPWQVIPNVKPFLYAGAFLPNSHLFLCALFAAVKELKQQQAWPKENKLFFLGTGNYSGKSILDYAKEYGIADEVFEVRKRFPFLHILNFLSAAYTVMVIGSTEKHYTASKTFQAILSKRPVFAVFHKDSSAVKFMNEANAHRYLVKYEETDELKGLKDKMIFNLQDLLEKGEKGWGPDFKVLKKFSSREQAKLFVDKINSLML